MINEITIYLPSGGEITFVVGRNGVEQIFLDKEKKNTVVVVAKTEIFEFSEAKYSAKKARKNRDIVEID